MRALILAFEFPPHHSVAALRPLGWKKFLPRHGVQPTFVVKQWPDHPVDAVSYYAPPPRDEVVVERDGGVEVHQVPVHPNLRDRLLLTGRLPRLRKLLSLVQSVSEHILPATDNRRELFHHADRLLRDGDFDVIVATGNPFVLFRHARDLSRRHGIPWVADYRDGWSTNEEVPSFGRLRRMLYQRIFRRIERWIVGEADAITAASPAYLDKVRTVVPGPAAHTVYNGYMPDVAVTPVQTPSTFVIDYAGTVYPHQRLETFLRGLDVFIERTGARDVRVNFFGLEHQPEQVRRLEAGLTDRTRPLVHTTARISYERILGELAGADVCLLLAASGYDWLNAKVFDYLYVDRPILLVESDRGTLEGLLGHANAGVACGDAEATADALTAWYETWRTEGRIDHRSTDVERYSRDHQAGVLADILHDLSSVRS